MKIYIRKDPYYIQEEIDGKTTRRLAFPPQATFMEEGSKMMTKSEFDEFIDRTAKNLFPRYTKRLVKLKNKFHKKCLKDIEVIE